MVTVASSRRIHVVHVVRAGSANGGMENGIINVANGLPADRYRVSVCILDSMETFSQRIRRPDSEYYLLPKRGRGIDWGLVRRLAQLLRRAGADLVHSHNWGTFIYAVLAAKLARLPIIHGEHGKNLGELDGDGRLKYWTKALLGRRVDRLVTVSQALAAEWLTYGIPAKKIQWIPNGIDVARFRPRLDSLECRRKFALPEGGFLIGSVGRLDLLKNYDVLLAAFARIARDSPSLHLALLGHGPQEQSLREQVHTLGIAGRVSFLGHHPDPENFLTALNIFVLPSKTEGMSNVVLEAMASGLPVVCADLAAHREVFEPDREGIVVSPCTAEMLAEALAALCRNPQQRQNLGSAARGKSVARFDLQRMVADYERLYAACGRVEAAGDTVKEELSYGA